MILPISYAVFREKGTPSVRGTTEKQRGPPGKKQQELTVPSRRQKKREKSLPPAAPSL